MQTVVFLPCPYMTEMERRSLVSPFYIDTNPIRTGPTLMTLFNLNYSLNSSTAALKVRASVYESRGLEGTSITSTRLCKQGFEYNVSPQDSFSPLLSPMDDAKPGSHQEDGGRQEGRGEHCYIMAVTTVGAGEVDSPRQTPPGRAGTQPPYPSGPFHQKKYVERSKLLQKEKSWKKGKERQQRKGGEMGGEERGWKDRWSSEKQQRESPDMTADRRG